MAGRGDALGLFDLDWASPLLRLLRYCADTFGLKRPAGTLSPPFCSECPLSADGDMTLDWLLGELESTESERPFVSEGEASREVLVEKIGPSSKLVTGLIEAMRLGVPFDGLVVDVEGRSGTGDLWCNLASWSIMLFGPAFLALVVPGEADLRLGLSESSEARPRDVADSAVPGRLDPSLLRVSLFDLGENMSFLMVGNFWGGSFFGQNIVLPWLSG